MCMFTFTHVLADQVRRQEKIRFFQLITVVAITVMAVTVLLLRIQYKDESLRRELERQCVVRNQAYDLNRDAFTRIASQANTEAERKAWKNLLAHYPPVLDCAIYVD